METLDTLGRWGVGETRRQSLQRGATPLGGFADLKEVAWEPPFGFTSRLRRETRLQRWIHRNALAH
ncbi:MAG: hypothetical protein RM347_012820 [Nostoc sp. ChiQUE02]|uniref:hypothetical protein n=1 Tax=Nostoc sp. ChiQUE02 TaxID=3075377 RepID=UPI002AD2FA8F|nr:hypothetical protein [Nostoc sp. ChiQUE02]MDZ8233464.1 hypothetical protein [Nostoc sp. ChiQUE02]